jgi:hypothetical protein
MAASSFVMAEDIADRDGVVESGEPSEAELAMELQNPIASLISVPIQNNWDFGIGPADAMRYTANIQPVIPFSLNGDWNLITRTILPVIYVESPVSGGDSKAGLGDMVQSFFFSPRELVGGWILGGGPVFLYPSATEDDLGTKKWGVGPTLVVLQQREGWTYGILANHVWSFAGDEARPDVSATFLQPFVSYTTTTHTSFSFTTESTYDWEAGQWTVPLNIVISQLLKIGRQPLSFNLGGRYYPERPDNGPDWGIRFVLVLLFPK